jgi:hypothetical protein
MQEHTSIRASAQAPVEPFRTMREVSELIQIPYYQVVRAVKAGVIPHHTLLNGKKYLLLSEVLATIRRHGGEMQARSEGGLQ